MTTNFATATYQEVIDLHTESDTVSVVGVHTPTGDVPRSMMPGFFKQFHKYKYNGCSLQLVPAARLPADPLQVSYEAGEATIDPRDLLNPILWHGCHGNDLGHILNQFYFNQGNLPSSGSTDSDDIDMISALYSADSAEQSVIATAGNEAYFADLYERLYYQAMTDNTWAKAHPLKGFRKSGLHPLVYQMAVTQQIGNGVHGSYVPGTTFGSYDPESDSWDSDVSSSNLGTSTGSSTMYFNSVPGVTSLASGTSGWTYSQTGVHRTQFLTNKLTSLGWMDTRVRTYGTSRSSTVSDTDPTDDALRYGVADFLAYENYAQMPMIYMGVMLLPPAYKTEQYYRLILNHSFSFKGFRGVSMMSDTASENLVNGNVANWNE